MAPRSSCGKKEVLKRGPWTAEEDKLLTAYIQQHGHGSWQSLPEKAGLRRCGKSCRLRWINYLRPDIKRGKFSLQEEQTIIQLHALLGNRWSAMAAHLPKRTDNEIKNHWNTHLKKRLIKMGIDPMTHKPAARATTTTTTTACSNLQPGPAKNTTTTTTTSNLSHMAQWESARLEAEARLVRESKSLAPNPIQPQPKTHPTIRTITKPRCLDVLKAWQGVVAGMFGVSSHDLGSPTSTLSSPIALGGLNGYSDGRESEGGLKDVDEGMMINGSGCYDVGLHEDMTDIIDEGAWFDDEVNNNNIVPIDNIMEGLSDALNVNSGFLINSSMGTVEKLSSDQENSGHCWDISVLNLVNSSPFGSPVF